MVEDKYSYDLIKNYFTAYGIGMEDYDFDKYYSSGIDIIYGDHITPDILQNISMIVDVIKQVKVTYVGYNESSAKGFEGFTGFTLYNKLLED